MRKEKLAKLGEPLNMREIAVLRFAAAGYTSRETAERLHFGYGTIKEHRRNVFAKLGARNMEQAVALAWRAKALP